MISPLRQPRGTKRAGAALAGALLLFASGYALAPSAGRHTAAYAPVRLAAAPGADLGPLPPIPAEVHHPTASERADADSDMPPVETYSRVMARLEQSAYKKPTSERELTYAAIRGMLASLGDRYTRFLDPDEFRRMQQENEGEFGGIGAKLEKVQAKTVVKEVVPNTPAQRAALKAGDAILAVNGQPVVGTSILKVVDLIRGEKGTPVRLTLERKGMPKPFDKTMIRDTIKLPTVTAEMILGPNKKPTGIAHIELTQFNQLAHSELDAAMKRMQKQGMKALIFDLRGNPGGLLTEAVAVGSRFVQSGPIVIIERGGQRQPMMADPNCPKFHGPLVVLVNKFSASASEIVSGAIKDTNSGFLVGVDTWGKGLVQTITPIQEDGSAVLITTHRYLTPAGIDINKKGIAPHYKVEMTKADIENKRDPQLDKAVALLKGELGGKTITAQAQSR